MVYFISVLRALAACLITNAHYEGIYPSDIIANGGLIGDIVFFAISGFCLYDIKNPLTVKGFASWYWKRLWRIVPPVWIITTIYMLLGFYKVDGPTGFVWWYLYPTYYHFVASIIVLYIPFFFLMKIKMLRNNLPKVMIGIAIVWFAAYLVFYDKSYYHIDSVYEPMIRFLFMESMLLGAWFRSNDGKLRNKRNSWHLIATAVLFFLYFISKLAFSKFSGISSLQIINQVIIFVLLFFIFRAFCGFDKQLEKLPQIIKSCIGFVSKITLEVYVVQYVIIDVIRSLGLFFPVNWLLITASILVSAFILHKCCEWIYKSVEKVRRLNA